MLIQNFRQWWQPPRPLKDREQHRQVTFLELFYDLVYVALIAEITHSLASHVDLKHVLNFAFLFIVVWWAWLNGTLYHDIHGNNDIRTRVFTFMQMFTIAAMAIFAHDALGDTSVQFALSYAAFQLILTFLWWRTGVYDPNHRPLSNPYSLAFLVTTLLFIGSVFVGTPLRFYLWGLATGTSVVFPLFAGSLGRNSPEVQAQIDLSRTATASLVERFGLFTIIVLGEVVVAVVQGMASVQDLTAEAGIIGVLGLLIAIALWWLFFDLVSHRRPITFTLWGYMHLPVTAGIAMTGASVLNVVEHAGEDLPDEVRWLLVGAISMVLVSIVILVRVVETIEDRRGVDRSASIAILAAVVPILLLGLIDIEIIPLLVVINLFMLTPVYFGLNAWVQMRIENQKTGHLSTDAD